MSKYVKYNLTTIRNQELLLAALAELGWHSGKVEVHDTPVALFGYHGDKRKETAHIVIRRNNTGISSSNDIGFLKNADGSYTPVISEYDSSLTGFGQRSGGRLVDKVQEAYGKVAGNAALSTVLNTTIPRWKRLGKIPRHATANTVVENGATKVVVRYA